MPGSEKNDSTQAAETAIRVLVVEDEASARLGLTELIRTWGFLAEAASDGVDALGKITTFRPVVVLADLVMPRLDGLGLLRALKDELHDLTYLMITAQGSVDTAVEAMRAGAYDYLTKPVDPNRLRILLDRVVERRDTLREVAALRRQLHDRGRFGRTVGSSPAMRKVYRLIEQAAPTAPSVLIAGESGTGKELVAQTIHQLSPRADFPFIAINCAAIPETLLESEIFGHERGAFTGATERRAGCFELAHRGTLFLDEIAEMAPGTQVKLLRVLQERTVRRLGSQHEQPFNVRIITATNADLHEAVEQGQLREDLFYRINVVAITLPPLRERREDIPLLVQEFLAEFSHKNQKALKAVEQQAMHVLERARWRGNIRQLRNVIERAVILTQSDFIEVGHLPPELLEEPERRRPGSPQALTPGMRVDEAERRLIAITLEHTHSNKTRAAEILGISVKTLHNKLNRIRRESQAAADPRSLRAVERRLPS